MGRWPFVLKIKGILLSLALLGCDQMAQPLAPASTGLPSSSLSVGCGSSSASSQKQTASSKIAKAIPKVLFNTGSEARASSKLIAEKGFDVGDHFFFAVDRQCAGESSVDLKALEALGQLKLKGVSSTLLYGRLTLSGPFDRLSLHHRFSEMKCVKTIETYKQFQLSNLPADDQFVDQAYLERVGFHESYSRWIAPLNTLQESVIVAVIDSGVDIAHPDLAGQIWQNSAEVPGDATDNDGNGFTDDVNGFNFVQDQGDPRSPDLRDDTHGTAVAGLIGAASNDAGIVGLMPAGVEIMSLNVFSDQGFATSEDIAAAIDYAVANGAKVINMSLTGANESSVLRLAIEQAIAAGVTVVSAAGNFGDEIDSDGEYAPGSYASSQDGAINVGALNSEDMSYALYSNRSQLYVEIAAPGSFQYSLEQRRGLVSLDVNGAYARHIGTSFAAPLVSGAAAMTYALYHSRYSSYPSAARVEKYLSESATPYTHLEGLVQGCKALDIDKLSQAILED